MPSSSTQKEAVPGRRSRVCGSPIRLFRLPSIRTITNCIVFELKQEDMQKVWESDPTLKMYMEEAAKKKFTRTNSSRRRRRRKKRNRVAALAPASGFP